VGKTPYRCRNNLVEGWHLHRFDMMHIISHQAHSGLDLGAGGGGGGGGSGEGSGGGEGGGSGVDGGGSSSSKVPPAKPAHLSSVKLVLIPSHLQSQSSWTNRGVDER
jgi:hypothetical protein